MIFFVLGLHLLQSGGHVLVRGRLGSQRQEGLGDQMVGVPAAVFGAGEEGAQVAFP